MVDKVLEASFAGLLHDIGKFGQRTVIKSDLNEKELFPVPTRDNHYTHLHSGYTSRFFMNILKLENEFERLTSSHHKDEDNDLLQILKSADVIASKIDRRDDDFDFESNNSKGHFITKRMNSIFYEVDFGKQKENAIFDLCKLSNLSNPIVNYQTKSIDDASEEYARLYEEFIDDVKRSYPYSQNITRNGFDVLYAKLQEYTSTIPSSTYQGGNVFVSLFDHLKLTSAIAGCLAITNNKKDFCMLEFDISGIQKFIYKVTEGREAKKGIAKALRGRSFLVSLICNYVAYAFLNIFSLTQANIIFNTGGGALLLLPYTEGCEEIIKKKYIELSENLYALFKTEISFVYSAVKCNETELEEFKVDKAIELKANLEKEKFKKHNLLLNDDFYFTSSTNKVECPMCETTLIEIGKKMCDVCKKITVISEFLSKNDNFLIYYSFDSFIDKSTLTIGNDSIKLCKLDAIKPEYYQYLESINCSKEGSVTYLANSVPIKNGDVVNFEGICNYMIEDSLGDKKMGILKMDVDNLGAIFAYGLKKGTRSISKYLTLSRMLENFFGIKLVEICKETSEEINPNIQNYADNGTMFYINYAGGDDLVIIGPVKGILYLALEIRKKFDDFVLNENITLSAGIYIQKPKEPIRFGIEKAEEMLSDSKNNKDKNSISLLDNTLSYSDYSNVLQKAEEYKNLLEQNKVSRGMLYQHLRVMDEKSYHQFIRTMPLLLYSIERNIKDETIKRNLKENVVGISNDKQIKKKVLEIQIALLFSREV